MSEVPEKCLNFLRDIPLKVAHFGKENKNVHIKIAINNYP